MARTGRKAATNRLRALLASGGGTQHHTQFAQEAYKRQSDRAAALVVAANTDNAIRYGLSRRLAVAYEDDRLFGAGSPMDAFDKKIIMAAALQLIADVCKFLVLPIVNPPKAVRVHKGKIIKPRRPRTARKLFTAVCDAITHNIMVNGQRSTQHPRQDQRYPGCDIWLKPSSLP